MAWTAGLRFVPVVLAMVLCGLQAVPRELLYPFGPETGDKSLPANDDYSSDEIPLAMPVVFFKESFRSIFVNMNGHVSFETEIPNYQANLVLPMGFKMIAVFLADVDTRASGRVYYRETQNQELLQRASEDIQAHFEGKSQFFPRSMFIVTWDRVGYYNQQNDKVNTFQLVLATDSRSSFAFFHYLDNGIAWISSQGKLAPNVPDITAQAGFDRGNGFNQRNPTLPSSGSSATFVNGTNVNIPGAWIYDISEPGPDGSAKPADVNTGKVTIFEVGVDQTCLEGSRFCHINARCLEFDQGVCCQCLPEFYGNGKQCLKADVPQRLNGRVLGTVNGVTLNNLDMHTYVATKDGRTYTAISRVPASLGPALQTLSSVGGAIGWLFALPTSEEAINGFTYTGGVFNRTAVVNFQQGNRTIHTVRVVQHFMGHGAIDKMRMDTHINGDLPEIAEGSKISIDDYNENYQRVQPGLVRSFSVRTYRVNDVAFRYTWDQTLTFEECEADPTPKLPTMRLVVNRNFVSHSSKDQVVRYAMSNKVSVMTGHDECAERGIICDAKARCMFEGGAFKCQCLPGYQGDGDYCEREEPQCRDSDCGENAACAFNTELGRAVCTCKTGFRGDGVTCSPIQFTCNEADICGDNAECIFDMDTNSYVCQCLDDFSGDGYTCEPKDSAGCQQCSRDATCVFDIDRYIYYCICRAGYTGNGITCTPIDRCGECDENADCNFNPATNQFQCQCRYGFYGDGFRCAEYDCRERNLCAPNAVCDFDVNYNAFLCKCPVGYKGDGFRCDAEGCDVVNDCDTNARCVPDPAGTRSYVCQCNPGFEGDGKVCLQRVTPCNQVNNCDRNAECVYDPDALSYRCRCSRGYEGDGMICRRKDLPDCRSQQGMCDRNADCVEGANGLYVCVCKPNFRGDGRTCTESVREGDHLLYARGHKVFSVSTNPQPWDYGQQLNFSPGQLAVGVDTDCAAGMMYWTDAAHGIIRKAALNGTNSQVIMTGLGSPEGIAVDFLSRTLFFTDSKLDEVGASMLDGTYRTTLFNTDMVNPRAIVLDVTRGKIYWTDWNRNKPQIEASNMDGTDRQVLVNSDLKLPNGLAFDHFSQQLCWADAGTKRVECMRSDGLGRRIVSTEAEHPFGLAILNNIIYWTDWKKKTISGVSQNGGDLVASISPAVGGNGRLYGITALRDQCPRGTNSCAFNNGGCPFLCFPTPSGGRSCPCPDGIDPRICQEDTNRT